MCVDTVRLHAPKRWRSPRRVERHWCDLTKPHVTLEPRWIGFARAAKFRLWRLFGWATGGQWAGFYARLFLDKLRALIMLNILYGASSVHPLMGHGSDMEDRDHPGHFNSSA